MLPHAGGVHTCVVSGDTDHSLRSVAVKRDSNISDPGWALVMCSQGLQQS